MYGCSLARARRSKSFDSVDKLDTGLTLLKSLSSRPGYLSSGAIRPAFLEDGKRPALSDVLTMCAMRTENSALHNLTTESYSWSNGEVFVVAGLVNRPTSDVVT